MKPIKAMLVFLVLSGISLSAQQKEDYSKYPGYFNYKEISGLQNAVSLSEVYLEETLLKMVAGMAEGESGDAGDLIGGLKLVQVNEYKIDKSSIENVEGSLDVMDKSLLSRNWDRIVRTNSHGNLTNIYVMKSADGQFAGLTILSLSKQHKDEESSETYGRVSCVNIVGKIDMSKIGRLTKELNLPGMEKMKGKEKGKE
jgi:prophage maintenance system killer protein